jgi:hypothetical protein
MKRLVALAALLAAPALAQERPVTIADLFGSGDLICDLYKSGAGARRARSPDMLLIFDRVGRTPGAARMISSRGVGARQVKIYSGATGVHLVQDLTGSVVVTSLVGCDSRSPAGRCLRYSTVNAWHFDQRVHRHPDEVFRRLPGTSYSGSCEAWYMDDARRAGSEPAERLDVLDGAASEGG